MVSNVILQKDLLFLTNYYQIMLYVIDHQNKDLDVMYTKMDN